METLALWVPLLASGVVVVGAVAGGVRWFWRRYGYSSKQREGKVAAVIGGGRLSRVPLLDKSVPSSGLHAGRVVEAVRSGLPIPSVLRNVDSRAARVWRYARRLFSTRGPSRKPFFGIEAWEYAPVDQLGCSVVYEHSEGFALLVKLAEGELAGHLKSSAASFSSYEVTVVVAPLESLEDNQVTVYCFKVTSVGMHVDKRCPQRVMFFSERPGNSGGPTAWSVLDQAHVPPNALWLICDHGEVDLGDGWEKSGSGRQMGRPIGAAADEALIKTIRRQVRLEMTAKIGVWALVAFAVPVAALLAVPDFWVTRGAVIDFGIYWITYVCVLALVVLLRALWDQARGWNWRRKGVRGDRWTGRTTWSLAAGRMVRQVTLLPGKTGQDLWETVWPQHSSTETLPSERPTLDTDPLD